jgi:hypothetical protein
MKKVVFIVSHHGSGSLDLIHLMNLNPRIHIQNNGSAYHNPKDLDVLCGVEHKVQNAAAIYGDHLVLNGTLSCRAIFEACQFIYVIRSAQSALNAMWASNVQYSVKNLTEYYCFRLRRICEMAKRTPGAVLLTWDDLTSAAGLPLIEEYLELKKSLEPSIMHFIQNDEDFVPAEFISRGEESYERYLYYLKQLDLKTNL